MSRALACSLVLATALAACSQSEPPAPATAAATAATTATTATATPAEPAADAVTGVADCDQFLSAYEQCLSEKMPAQARDQMKIGMEQWKSAWRDMARNDATKASLPQICQQARASSKPALDAYGCSL